MPFKYKQNAIWFICDNCGKKQCLGPVAEDLRIYECSNPSCDYVELYHPLGKSLKNAKPKITSDQTSQEKDETNIDLEGYELQIQRLNTFCYGLLEEIRLWKRILAIVVPILLTIIIPLGSVALSYFLSDKICTTLKDEFRPALQSIKNSNNEIKQNLDLIFEEKLIPELQKLKSTQNTMETDLQELRSTFENQLKFELQDLKESQDKISKEIREVRIKINQFESNQKETE